MKRKSNHIGKRSPIMLYLKRTILSALVHHLLNICSESPPCNMPGVANTTIAPGLSIRLRSNGCKYHTMACSIARSIR